MKRTISPSEFESYFGRTPGYPSVSRNWCGISHFHSGGCQPGYVYVARGLDSAVKIGHVQKVERISTRMAELCTQYNMGFVLLFALKTHCARGLERKIHKQFSTSRVKHDKGTELFRLSDRQMRWLSSITIFTDKPVERVAALDLL